MKSEGIHVGRPAGAKNNVIKLTGKSEEIRLLLERNIPKVQIAKRLGVHRSTLRRYLMDV
jgi:IS30 family transposase